MLDLGKAVAMLLGNGGDPLDYLEVIGHGKPITRPSAPFVAVPTTAGTGAEVTANAVLASPEHGRKASLRAAHDAQGRPRRPAAHRRLPEGGHRLQRPGRAHPVPRAVRLVAGNTDDRRARPGGAAPGRVGFAAGLPTAPNHARTDMALCSLLGGMALANAKLGAVHGFAGVIGGMVSAPRSGLRRTTGSGRRRERSGAAGTGADPSGLDRYGDAARF